MRMAAAIVLALAIWTAAAAQQDPVSTASTSGYQPKFAGDKARSNAEAAALGYMRTVVAAEKVYKKKRGSYTSSLSALVGNGSFTKRMAQTDRGDYTVSMKSKAQGYALTLTPKQFDAEHRAFYVDETGVFRAEDDKPATSSSPVLK
ncbi:MAG TPA: hypothetical protein VD837_19090 [Terriglobales bacterium]|nr:hypothetical protein [Terriglobales bacterium]